MKTKEKPRSAASRQTPGKLDSAESTKSKPEDDVLSRIREKRMVTSADLDELENAGGKK